MAAWRHGVSLFFLHIRGYSPPTFSFVHTLTLALIRFFILGGPKAAFGSAVACGILLGVFEGVGVLLGRVFSESTRQQLPPCKFSFQLLPSSTQLSALASTGVNDSSDTIIGCYLILVAYTLFHTRNPPRAMHCAALHVHSRYWDIGTHALI